MDDPSLIRARLRALGYDERSVAGTCCVFRVGTDELVHTASTWGVVLWLRDREREAYGRAVEDEHDSPAETRRRLEEWRTSHGRA